MRKYETPTVEVVSFDEEIMLSFLFGGDAAFSGIEDCGDL